MSLPSSKNRNVSSKWASAPPTLAAAATNAASAISLPARAGVSGVGIDAVSALGGEDDTERDQLAVFARNDAVLAFDGVVERHKCVSLGGCEAGQVGNQDQVVTSSSGSSNSPRSCATTERARKSGKQIRAL
jgi:hypothetical protein